jgi:hypothetical protein
VFYNHQEEQKVGKMEFERVQHPEQGAINKPPKFRSKTPDRITYETEVEVIRKQIGDLEDIRFRLGLSARKMAQLLMVDPSAWTRWTRKITPPPPHIFRALQWYLCLLEKSPGFTPQIFLASRWYRQGAVEITDMAGLQSQIQTLKSQIELLELRLQRQSNLNRWLKLAGIMTASFGLAWFLHRFF